MSLPTLSLSVSPSPARYLAAGHSPRAGTPPPVTRWCSSSLLKWLDGAPPPPWPGNLAPPLLQHGGSAGHESDVPSPQWWWPSSLSCRQWVGLLRAGSSGGGSSGHTSDGLLRMHGWIRLPPLSTTAVGCAVSMDLAGEEHGSASDNLVEPVRTHAPIVAPQQRSPVPILYVTESWHTCEDVFRVLPNQDKYTSKNVITVTKWRSAELQFCYVRLKPLIIIKSAKQMWGTLYYCNIWRDKTVWGPLFISY